MAHTERAVLLQNLQTAQQQTTDALVINERTEKILRSVIVDGISVFLSINAEIPEISQAEKERIEKIGQEIVVGGKYQHVKSGGEYQITAVGLDAENGEPSIAYQELNHQPPITWLRSYACEDGWSIPTDINGVPSPRFVEISQ